MSKLTGKDLAIVTPSPDEPEYIEAKVVSHFYRPYIDLRDNVRNDMMAAMSRRMDERLKEYMDSMPSRVTIKGRKLSETGQNQEGEGSVKS